MIDASAGALGEEDSYWDMLWEAKKRTDDTLRDTTGGWSSWLWENPIALVAPVPYATGSVISSAGDTLADGKDYLDDKANEVIKIAKDSAGALSTAAMIGLALAGIGIVYLVVKK